MRKINWILIILSVIATACSVYKIANYQKASLQTSAYIEEHAYELNVNEGASVNTQVSFTEVENVAKVFIDSVCLKNADGVNAAIQNGSPFLFDESDIETLSFSNDLMGSELDLTKNMIVTVCPYTIDYGAREHTIQFKINNVNSDYYFEFSISLESDGNTWRVNDSGILRDVMIAIPGDYKIKFGDVVIDRSFCIGEYGVGGLLDLYRFPVIGRSEKRFTLSSDQTTLQHTVDFGDYKTDNVIALHHFFINDEKIEKCMIAIQTMWQEAYDAASDKQAELDLSQYFIDVDHLTTSHYTALIDELKLNDDKSYDTNHKITNVNIWEGEKAVYVTKNVIAVNLQYTISWDRIYDDRVIAMSVDRKSNVLMYECDGEYKFYRISDSKLFSIDDDELGVLDENNDKNVEIIY